MSEIARGTVLTTAYGSTACQTCKDSWHSSTQDWTIYGPIHVQKKIGEEQQKHWVALFTCFSTRMNISNLKLLNRLHGEVEVDKKR